MGWVLEPDEGEVYTTGSNDSGQLGARGRDQQVVPMRVAALDTHIVTHIACGSTHTVAVTGNDQRDRQKVNVIVVYVYNLHFVI